MNRTRLRKAGGLGTSQDNQAAIGLTIFRTLSLCSRNPHRLAKA